MSSLINSLLTGETFGFGLSQAHAVIVQAIICTFFLVASFGTLLAFCVEKPKSEDKKQSVRATMLGGFFLGMVFLASLTGLTGLF